MGKTRPGYLYLIAGVAGIGVWVAVTALSGRREAWDSPLYFQAGLPVLCLVAAVLGFTVPERAWRWGAMPLVAQTAWMFATLGLGNLWPLGLLAGAVLSMPLILASRVGAFLRRRLT